MELKGTTGILGIFGDPVSHSLSPLMQNAALAQAGMDKVYVPFHVRPADLEAAVNGIRALQILGVNVTVPHKESVCDYLDELDEDARLIGAVNAIVNRNGRLVGYNTDGLGFIRSLAEDLDFDPRDKRILLLGAGGACRAAVVALARAGARWVGIANRTPERAQKICTDFRQTFPGVEFAAFALTLPQLENDLKRVDILVNTSALGLKGESFDTGFVQNLDTKARVYDMVYSRDGLTPLLGLAAEYGIKAADGRGMLAGQGEEAFFLWTGQQAPRGVMRKQIWGES